MGKKLGGLIKSARTQAGFTQEQLAAKVKGVSRADIGKFERGEAEPTAQNVKDIAKACGVTQKSLLDAMPKSQQKPSSSTASAKPSASKPSTSASKPSTSKPSTTQKSSLQVTATERRLIELYRAADAETRKKALAVLRGTSATADEPQIPGVDDVIAGLGSLLIDALGKK